VKLLGKSWMDRQSFYLQQTSWLREHEPDRVGDFQCFFSSAPCWNEWAFKDFGTGFPQNGEMEECYLEMLSTGNILDESVRGDSLPYEGKSSPAVTRDCPNRGRDLSADSSAAILDVADLAAGNAPVKDSPLVGSSSGVSTSARVDAPGIHSSLDHFTNRITRYVDKKLGRETERFA
jgi:hypothetical protein